MGVLQLESGFDSGIQNQQGGSAYGLCQWLSTRLTELQAFAKTQPGRTQPDVFEKTTPPTNPVNFLYGGSFTQGLSSDFDIQILFLKGELLGTQGGGVYKNLKVNDKIKASTTVEQAVRVWLELFEGIPEYITKNGRRVRNVHWTKQAHLPKRIGYANDFLKRMKETAETKTTLNRTSDAVKRFKGKSFYGAY